MKSIIHINDELCQDGLVGAKQLRVLLIDLLDAGSITHALGKPCYDSSHWVPWHQARQHEIQQEGGNKCDSEPTQLVDEILSISFHCTPPRIYNGYFTLRRQSHGQTWIGPEAYELAILDTM